MDVRLTCVSLGNQRLRIFTVVFFYFLLRHISMTLPASFRGKNTTRPDYEHQNSNLYAISGQKKNVTEQILDFFFGVWLAVNKKRHLSELSFSAMDGVPFMISEKFACASSDVSCLDWVFGLLLAGWPDSRAHVLFSLTVVTQCCAFNTQILHLFLRQPNSVNA